MCAWCSGPLASLPLAGWSMKRAKYSTACSGAAAAGKTSTSHLTGLAGRQAARLSTSSGTREKRCTAFVMAENPGIPSVSPVQRREPYLPMSRVEPRHDEQHGPLERRWRSCVRRSPDGYPTAADGC